MCRDISRGGSAGIPAEGYVRAGVCSAEGYVRAGVCSAEGYVRAGVCSAGLCESRGV